MNIRKRRVEKGWSQEELARHSGLSTRTIQRIESGHNACLESLKCLAAVFETSISVLAQEQTMTEQNSSKVVEKNHLLKIERDAIDFAQSILNGTEKKNTNAITKIERDAINYAKRLLRRFSTTEESKPN